MDNAKYGKLTAGLIAAWFVFTLVASAQHVFRTDFSRPAIFLGLAALTPIVVFAVWFAASKGFRQFVESLNVGTLTFVQSWRIAGYVFLVLYVYSILPGVFALSAGWGDVFIGATAPFVALRLANPEHRKSFILWQVLGILDLVLAVTFGTTARLIAPHGISTTPLTVLPLSLIPTFAVPLLLILHLICIGQARRARASANPCPLAPSKRQAATQGRSEPLFSLQLFFAFVAATSRRAPFLPRRRAYFLADLALSKEAKAKTT